MRIMRAIRVVLLTLMNLGLSCSLSTGQDNPFPPSPFEQEKTVSVHGHVTIARTLSTCEAASA